MIHPVNIVEYNPRDKVLAVDTEYDPCGNLLTIGVANRTEVRVWDCQDGVGGTE